MIFTLPVHFAKYSWIVKMKDSFVEFEVIIILKKIINE